ncbi:Transcriptional regulator, contains XRE-family HTH domain [Kaistia soli DSM 19436]|uniref:Transcriptional regulator, contains XRE-family HTH domain n=1 Tax=Kaistia soli DSM 19436 TaxID=1122133 RepID=A0A1M5K216_9HYPH|nr:helix-turn-helix transcriptional regulator [Kaistia soli]SHG46818.1 Transcriptional regulator, contains XRE-family HTH domain [Kaistia soli DSM 19436]
MTATSSLSFGEELRNWRLRRRLSQLDLAGEADLSTRHLSFLETGRSRPSRAMVLKLAERLDLPLREQNGLLLAAGFAPVHAERRLDDPGLAAARDAVRRIVEGHDPYPALAIDRHWTMIEANAAVASLIEGVDPVLLRPPVNVLRLALHPAGLAARTVDFLAWRGHLLGRLAREAELTGDPRLSALHAELESLPAGGPRRTAASEPYGGIALPFRLRVGDMVLSFITTTTVFGGPADVTLSELAIEAFFPADAETAARLRGLALG